MKSMQGMKTEWKFLQPKPYRDLGEESIALLGIVIWFIAILARHHLPDASDWLFRESLLEAFSFVVFAAVPIFGLGTPIGEQIAKQILLPIQGFGFQLALCTALAALITLGKELHFRPNHFAWIAWNDQYNPLIKSAPAWLNTALFLGGVFVALRLPFVVQDLRKKPQPRLRWQLYVLLLLNTLYLCCHNTTPPWEDFTLSIGFIISMVYGVICIGLTWPHRRSVNALPNNRLVPSDFWLMVLCVAILYWFSIPGFSFGVCIGIDLFILVIVYGSGLGRDHFGYSFVTRPKDWSVLGVIILAVILVLVPLAIASGFVQPAFVQSQFSPLKLAVYFALFTFRVGIFEEVFFRAGVMVLLRDCLSQESSQGSIRWIQKRSPQALLWLPALGCSVLFGLAHIGNSGGSNTLPLWQYRGFYILLATLASLLYSIAFAKTNRLAVPILVHGFVDTTAVVLLGGSLTVPF
jgi:membrane protease YdiL (CAAX protease family)